MNFSKSLAKYYITWFDSCHKSAIYLKNKGDEKGAQSYLKDAEKYLMIICENWDAIEFFSIGDRAFIRNEALPIEFRGYN